MTEDEKREAVMIAESLGPSHIAETLEDLIARERTLLETPMDGDMRAIVLHNVAVLTAACSGYQEAAKKQKEMLAKPEEGGDGGEATGLDKNPL